MKRRGSPLCDPALRKKSSASSRDEGELGYSLRMLRNWEISPEAARYL